MEQYQDFQISQLWQKIIDGDEDAIQELLRRFEGAIQARSRINGEINEDLAQDVRQGLYSAIKKAAQKQRNNDISNWEDK